MSPGPDEDETFDVAVIGAGPAGATAARLLATWGHSVALLGRAPSRRALAESLPPSCTKLFDQLGVRARIDGAGFVRATGNTVRWAGGDIRVEQFDAGIAGYQVPRDVFDAQLVAAAKSSARVVHRDATVTELVRGASAWTVVADIGGEPEGATARWVLDCTGRAGVLARRGQRRAESAARTMAVVAVWERDGAWPVDDDSHTLVESYDGGWAWSVPVSETRRYVTFMVDPALTAVPGRAQLGEAYAEELARTTMLRALVDGAQLIDGPWGCDASPYTSACAFGDHSLLIGDAASFVDPLSSFGVKKALASAWLGAVAVHTSLVDPGMSADALELFDDRERMMFTRLQRQSARLARDASSAHAGDFWSSRAAGHDGVIDEFGELDVEFLRGDARVLVAFAELRARDTIVLRRGDATRVVDGVSVQGNRIVRQQALANDVLQRGVRYCRNVDLIQLAAVATTVGDVGEMFERYNRTSPAVGLPDFLGALSAAIGLGILEVC